MQDETFNQASGQQPAPAPVTPQTPPPDAARRLLRSRNDRVLAGVAGGMGRFFGIDPTLVRIVWVVLTLAGGSGVLLYILAWIIIPEAPVGEEAFVPATPSSTGRFLVGGVLIAAGGLFLMQRIVPHLFGSEITWAVLLILTGVAVVVAGARR